MFAVGGIISWATEVRGLSFDGENGSMDENRKTKKKDPKSEVVCHPSVKSLPSLR